MNCDFFGINIFKVMVLYKFGIINYFGWLVYWFGGVIFVKYFFVVVGVLYLDFGCVWEMFINGEMIEFEMFSFLKKLLLGDSVLLMEYWMLIEGLEKLFMFVVFVKLSVVVGKWIKIFV